MCFAMRLQTSTQLFQWYVRFTNPPPQRADWAEVAGYTPLPEASIPERSPLRATSAPGLIFETAPMAVHTGWGALNDFFVETNRAVHKNRVSWGVYVGGGGGAAKHVMTCIARHALPF